MFRNYQNCDCNNDNFSVFGIKHNFLIIRNTALWRNVKTGRKSRLKKTTNNAFEMRNQWKNNESRKMSRKEKRPEAWWRGTRLKSNNAIWRIFIFLCFSKLLCWVMSMIIPTFRTLNIDWNKCRLEVLLHRVIVINPHL